MRKNCDSGSGGPSCARGLGRGLVRSRGLVVGTRDTPNQLREELAVFSRERHKRTPQVSRPRAAVREALETGNERCELDSRSPHRKRLNPKAHLDWVLALSKPDGVREFARQALDAGDAYHSASVARRITEATARRVEKDSIARLECLGLPAPVGADSGSLLGDDPCERFAVGDRKQIVGQRRSFFHRRPKTS
jgi:hypothetical protein